jgi:hypothetical protein
MVRQAEGAGRAPLRVERRRAPARPCDDPIAVSASMPVAIRPRARASAPRRRSAWPAQRPPAPFHRVDRRSDRRPPPEKHRPRASRAIGDRQSKRCRGCENSLRSLNRTTSCPRRSTTAAARLRSSCARSSLGWSGGRTPAAPLSEHRPEAGGAAALAPPAPPLTSRSTPRSRLRASRDPCRRSWPVGRLHAPAEEHHPARGGMSRP